MLTSLSMIADTPVSRGKSEAVDAIEAGVIRGNDAVAGLKPAQHFDLFGITPAELDGTAYGAGPVVIEHERPGATGSFKKRAGGKHHRRHVTAQFELALDRLAAPQPRQRGALPS